MERLYLYPLLKVTKDQDRGKESNPRRSKARGGEFCKEGEEEGREDAGESIHPRQEPNTEQVSFYDII